MHLPHLLQTSAGTRTNASAVCSHAQPRALLSFDNRDYELRDLQTSILKTPIVEERMLEQVLPPVQVA